MNKQQLMRRLSLSKFQFRSAAEFLQRPGSFNPSMATSLLQDAVETFLWTLSMYGRIKFDKKHSFDTLLDKVGDKFETVKYSKTPLTCLNNSRVGFKHYGNLVVNSDAQIFTANVERFFIEVCDKELNLDFSDVSLASAINHKRTENWLNEAEKLYNAEDYCGSVECSMKALISYCSPKGINWSVVNETIYPFRGFSRVQDTFHQEQEFHGFAEWTAKHLQKLTGFVQLLSMNLDLVAYSHFNSITPIVHMTMTNKFHTAWTFDGNNLTKKDSRFCIDFVIDTTLQINKLAETFGLEQQFKIVGEAKAKKDCAVRVYSSNDAEVIRTARSGENLDIVTGFRIPENGNFVAVLQDGEAAFVSSDDVELETPSID